MDKQSASTSALWWMRFAYPPYVTLPCGNMFSAGSYGDTVTIPVLNAELIIPFSAKALCALVHRVRTYIKAPPLFWLSAPQQLAGLLCSQVTNPGADAAGTGASDAPWSRTQNDDQPQPTRQQAYSQSPYRVSPSRWICFIDHAEFFEPDFDFRYLVRREDTVGAALARAPTQKAHNPGTTEQNHCGHCD